MTPEEFADYCDKVSNDLESMSFQEGLQLCKPIVQKKIANNFATTSDADGTKWEPRKPTNPPKTHPLEDLTSLMKNSLVLGTGGGFEDQGPTHLTLGIDSGTVPYANVQEYGNPLRNHPARSYSQVDDKTADECTEVMADWVQTKVFGDG